MFQTLHTGFHIFLKKIFCQKISIAHGKQTTEPRTQRNDENGRQCAIKISCDKTQQLAGNKEKCGNSAQKEIRGQPPYSEPADIVFRNYGKRRILHSDVPEKQI